MIKRCYHEVLRDILKCLIDYPDINKTMLMSKSNTNTKEMPMYINILRQRYCVFENTHRYKITNKGIRLYYLLNSLLEILD